MIEYLIRISTIPLTFQLPQRETRDEKKFKLQFILPALSKSQSDTPFYFKDKVFKITVQHPYKQLTHSVNDNSV